ncbi:FkbM family methyltransferase [Wenzhouxiangella sp. EGI_FJ10409]|uniref:FkbM family methyltransferase n=1 Tax=Wenzhouxiangella sp. EGI_FJ10409 TaxID=3243767 RepID=UPI0035DDD68A
MSRMLVRNLKNRLKGRAIKISKPEDRIGYLVDDGETQIRIAHLERARFYYKGIKARIDRLAESYLLSSVDWKIEDLMVDCGANIGELGRWAQTRNISYIGIEPEKEEYEVLCENIHGCRHYNGGLWSFEGELEFFSKPDTADSSFVEPPTYFSKKVIPVLSGQSLIQRFGIDRIKLLKVEAEGAEPEVLEGFLPVLSKIDFIVIEVGYERGINQEDTLMPCHRLLHENSFSLIKCRLKESKFLYRNTVLNEPS